MATLPDLVTFEMKDADKPRIGFRVFVSGGERWYQNTLRSGNPQAHATSLTLRHHLMWDNKSSPFISLWTSWDRAVEWAERRENSGGRHIDIVAVWIYDQAVYDAYRAAKTLQLPPDKRLHYYKNEVIIVDHGGEGDFSILAHFHRVTEQQWETVTFEISAEELLSTSLPIGSLEFGSGSDEERIEDREARRWRNRDLAALKDEVRSWRGPGHTSEAVILARLLAPKSFTSQDIASDELIAQLAELGI